MMRILPIVFVSATVALAAFEQDKPPQNPRPTIGQDSKESRTATREEDGILATWIAVESRSEVELARLAVQKASDPEVKKFAQSMIDEHTALDQKLRPFTNESGSLPRGGGKDGKDDKDGKDGKDLDRPVDASSARLAGGFDHAGLLREVGDECLRASRKELEQKQGAEFDRCYVGSAIGAHMAANSLLTVFQRHASSALKPVFGDAQGTVARHLQQAKDIAQRLEGKTGGSHDSVGGR